MPFNRIKTSKETFSDFFVVLNENETSKKAFGVSGKCEICQEKLARGKK
jgi:hypothetical protein